MNFLFAPKINAVETEVETVLSKCAVSMSAKHVAIVSINYQTRSHIKIVMWIMTTNEYAAAIVCVKVAK